MFFFNSFWVGFSRIRFELVNDRIARAANLLAQETFALLLQVLWDFLHLVIIVWHVILRTTLTLHSYLISSGLLKKYKTLDLTNLRYLAIVVEDEEAYDVARIVKLLQWLSQIRVKRICLYDRAGLLKECKKVILQELDAREWENDVKRIDLDQDQMTLEFASLSDGKAGIAKASSLLCSKYLKIDSSDGNQHKSTIFTESDLTEALREVGHYGPKPSLLLTYGAVRCHLGFPAWRTPYTEIVHMGPLKSMKYGALLKSIEEFTRVKQNYGA
ncbi:hypothetical protein C5167_017968 [Papaver somniferum]|uniref:ditrans,polycis-polyprenyl diphosphate synthase [(2E,6E)-farnesyldiphosphate specific] n=1 Tax=Papaver somniferum TaxID=3469 RepID=A0A4Y7IPX8_PAPSO|nr:hypothetical protein C5167_017968 [Papaver somniferum]